MGKFNTLWIPCQPEKILVKMGNAVYAPKHIPTKYMMRATLCHKQKTPHKRGASNAFQ